VNESLLRKDLLSGQRCVSGELGWISFGGTTARIAIMHDEKRDSVPDLRTSSAFP
jgi:hypothetical protein